jgi:glycerate 2-kinase
MVFDLAKVGHIYVIGGGKAAQRQAKALEDALGDLITDGAVNAKKGDTVYLQRVPVTLAGHPIPDDDSVAGARKIVEVASKARRGDIVFFSESGGGSALLTLPAPGITLQDLIDLNRMLYFEAGASMPDTNAVRNLMTVLRSQEVRYVGEATFIQISTDERPLGLRVYISRNDRATMSSDDHYAYATSVLKRYNCWERVSESVRQFLLAADPRYAPLRPEERARMNYFRVAGPDTMLDAAQKRATSLGINATIIASSISNVEAKECGEVFAYMAQEIEAFARPAKPPCVLLCGGELVVTVGDARGIGGRNQEFVLSMAPRFAGSDRVVAASVDSDGNDGPTDQAGGVVDGLTLLRAQVAGLDVFEELHQHNTSGLLRRLGDSIYTGVRGTNVQDLRVVYVAS